MTPPFMAESEEELNSLLMKVKEESEKVGLKFNIHISTCILHRYTWDKIKLKKKANKQTKKLNIQKIKIRASKLRFMTDQWGNNGKSERLLYGASKSLQMVTAAMKLEDPCSLEGKL